MSLSGLAAMAEKYASPISSDMGPMKSISGDNLELERGMCGKMRGEREAKTALCFNILQDLSWAKICLCLWGRNHRI